MSNLKTIYTTDGSLCLDRCDDEIEKGIIRQKWTVSTETPNSMMCGNIRVTFDNFKASLDNDELSTSSYMQISSALALYRTISLFECGLSTSSVDFYKMNWQINLQHNETGKTLGLGEWKGGFQIFTPYTTIKDVPAQYKKDTEELLSLLVSPTLTIGYDGTVAGTVA